eukprot:GHVS01091447.1.p1 GENE.GHVS01091447.1~~GHVS01091447.1.p1  ORF type:complete len:316 (+),score=81.73 GHVS01091447.1:208-1155(+)
MAQQQHQCDNNSGYGVLPFQSGLMLKKRILEAVHSVYRDADDDTDCGVTTAADESSYQPRMLSLPHIGAAVGVHVSETARKATVMVIGNVSAGKSTFVNWYTNSSIQKTGMAIETNGFTIVTCGDSYNELGGVSTAALYPHLQDLINRHNLYEHICTKSCPSKTLSPAGVQSMSTAAGRVSSCCGVVATDEDDGHVVVNNHFNNKTNNVNITTTPAVTFEGTSFPLEKITTTTTNQENIQQATTKHQDTKQQTNKQQQQHCAVESVWCGSRELLLEVVDIIDTPGLSDGDLSYDFDVVKVIEELSQHVDLVLVFF